MLLEISQLPRTSAVPRPADDAVATGNSTANLTLVAEYPENATAAVVSDNAKPLHSILDRPTDPYNLSYFKQGALRNGQCK